jgi:nucleoside-diphosphate kinase
MNQRCDVEACIMSKAQKIDRSLVLIKPDAVLRRQIGVNVLKALKGVSGLSVLAFKETKVPEDLAKQHYEEHQGKSFYPGLMAMMAVPVGVIVLVCEGPGIASTLRDMIGPTYVEKAKGSLRGMYGIAKGVNVIHASDNAHDGARESDLWINALGLRLDKAAAVKAMDAYIKKYDGHFPDNTRSIQKEAGDVLEAIEDLKTVLDTETNEDEETIRALLKAILHTMMG